MSVSRLLTGCLAAVVFMAGSQMTAYAASQITTAFLANLQSNVAFLDRSSRIASERASSASVRVFAKNEAEEQGKLASTLSSVMPLLASTDSEMVTGRSVAVDGDIGAQAGAQQAANGRVPMGVGDLDKLAALKGEAFDNLYWQAQLDALSQIEADYRAYIANGDDPVLVAMAKDELPKIISRLEKLSKI